MDKILYLGYVISEEGISSSPENIKAIQNYPRKFQQFIGLASYFRKCIPSFSILTKPLYGILKNDVQFTFGSDEL